MITLLINPNGILEYLSNWNHWIWILDVPVALFSIAR